MSLTRTDQRLLGKAVRYVKCNNRRRLGWLLARYPHLKSISDVDGPLTFAALYFNPAMLPWLLTQSANPNTRHSVGGTLLMAAGAANDIALARLLVSYGADVNLRNESGETAFSYCCANNSLECARALVSWGADINSLDEGGGTPLDWAVCWSSPEFQEWLASIGGRRKSTHAPWPWPLESRTGVCQHKTVVEGQPRV